MSKKIKAFSELIRKIEETNKIFTEASPEQKRVMIAQDCIDRVKLNQLIGNTGNIVTLGVYSQRNGSLQCLINDERVNTCKVCAKGGLLLSYVGRVNEMKVEDLNNGDLDVNSIMTSAHQKLLEVFSIEQLATIETAFEGMQYLEYDSNNNPIYLDIVYEYEFVNQYPDEDKRLIAICENIIKNNGTFIWKIE